MGWFFYALLSAFFAAVVAILGKVGVEGISSNLAVAVRTAVVLVTAWGILLFQRENVSFSALTGKNLLFLVLSGIATGLSWICYFKALSLGPASKVAPVDKLSVVFVIILAAVFLREPAEPKILFGGGLILAGFLCMVL